MTVEPITKPQRAKPANDPQVPHVSLAIKAIMKEVRKDGISKDRKNQQQSYNFRGIDDVLNVLSGMLPEADLIITPRMLSRTQVERATAKGGALFFSTVEADYMFESTIDGTTKLVGPFYGEAMDSADKATNKAMSAAYKYMAIQTFCIPTQGDNDADATTHEVAPAAGGERSPPQSQPRQQQKIVNPETGRMIDPNSPNQLRKTGDWERFERTVRAFRDIDELESWWSDADTQAKIEQQPAEWQQRATDEYEKRQEALLKAGAP